jgi:hypothetical protein
MYVIHQPCHCHVTNTNSSGHSPKSIISQKILKLFMSSFVRRREKTVWAWVHGLQGCNSTTTEKEGERERDGEKERKRKHPSQSRNRGGEFEDCPPCPALPFPSLPCRLPPSIIHRFRSLRQQEKGTRGLPEPRPHHDEFFLSFPQGTFLPPIRRIRRPDPESGKAAVFPSRFASNPPLVCRR